MIETIDTSLVDWSRAQFAMTAMYHWIFVPLTLGLVVIVAVMETLYYRTGREFWKKTTKFWMKIFGVNFAIGVATGLILEFQFGTNWSNYSWFVGDIFGAPLAIEGLLAFFMESTFIAVMFFGWNKVSKRFHLVATWLTALGATLSAWWILVANAWMQHPVGMRFNPDTVRNEMVDFWAVALSPVAVNKFFHTVMSGWVLGAVFVVGVSCWFLIKKRHKVFALLSIRIAAIFGLTASLLVAFTGDGSGYQIAQTQPMKLAAIEGLYQGKEAAGLVAVGVLNPNKQTYNDGVEPFLLRLELPMMLSLLAEREPYGFVPGISNLIDGGYLLKDGTVALSATQKMERGKAAVLALKAYKKAKEQQKPQQAAEALKVLEQNMPYFGYGYITDVNQLVPNVPLNFYAFRLMVILGVYFIGFFGLILYLSYRRRLAQMRWIHYVGLWTIPLGFIAGQAGWVVAECGRQPWAIRDLLPTWVSVSKLYVGVVQTTFILFLVLFTVLLIAEIGILLKVIQRGPFAPHEPYRSPHLFY